MAPDAFLNQIADCRI